MPLQVCRPRWLLSLFMYIVCLSMLTGTLTLVNEDTIFDFSEPRDREVRVEDYTFGLRRKLPYDANCVQTCIHPMKSMPCPKPLFNLNDPGIFIDDVPGDTTTNLTNNNNATTVRVREYTSIRIGYFASDLTTDDLCFCQKIDHSFRPLAYKNPIQDVQARLAELETLSRALAGTLQGVREALLSGVYPMLSLDTSLVLRAKDAQESVATRLRYLRTHRPTSGTLEGTYVILKVLQRYKEATVQTLVLEIKRYLKPSFWAFPHGEAKLAATTPVGPTRNLTEVAPAEYAGILHTLAQVVYDLDRRDLRFRRVALWLESFKEVPCKDLHKLQHTCGFVGCPYF